MIADKHENHLLSAGFSVLRGMLGAHFVWMGMVKALDPVDFLKLVRQYDAVTNHYLLNGIAAALPWFEVLCGLLLILGIANRGAALVLLGMLLPFTWLVFQRGWGLAALKHVPLCTISFDCGCGSGEVFICRKLLENTVLILIAVLVVTGKGNRWSLRHRLLDEPQPVRPA